MELIIEGTFERIKSGKRTYDFPVCRLSITKSSCTCYLNKKAASCLDEMERVNWYLNENYVICMPSSAVNGNRPVYTNGKFKGYIFPRNLLTSGRVKPGYYKLYRYKSGFAFKHYEPLKEENNG